eukprot:COSAG01_NODE_1963_length_8785_cov_56.285402_4_plen_67_part_00
MGGASRPDGRYQVQRGEMQQLFLQRGAGVDPTMAKNVMAKNVITRITRVARVLRGFRVTTSVCVCA